ncbi:MAG: twin-arginine translocation signal domain-containing protein, partial [Rhizobiales bacterium]|nr:twin-arginine translocation signal domain-containing protein [Hyphomicrobiales bacterium]
MSTALQFPIALEDAFQRNDLSTSRRNFLKASGALVVSLGTFFGTEALAAAGAEKPAGPYTDPDFRQLDTWIVIHPDNTATFFVGKTDGGQGTGTAFRQMMCDELDIAYDKTSL